MQISLLLLHYNNYYNRTYKRKDTVQQYVSEDPYESPIFDNVNFVPGDGVNTSVILGSIAQFSGGCDYDYCVAFDAQTQAIVSRWFVMHEERTRQGQYELTLKRDLVADYYECCLNSTAFVEKGWLPQGNKLIYNSESMEVSEIKVNETFLSDITNTPWLVAYVAKNAIQSDKRIVIPGADQEGIINVSVNDISNFVLYPYSTGTDLRVRPNAMTQANAHAYINAYCTPYGGGYVKSLDLGANRVGAFNDRSADSGTNIFTASYDYYANAAAQLNSLSSTLKDAVFSAADAENLIDAVTQATFDNYRNTYDGKTIKLTNGKLYAISFRSTASATKKTRVASSQYSSTFNAMDALAQAMKDMSPKYINWIGDGHPNDYAFEFEFTPASAYVVGIVEVQANEVSATLKTSHRATEDAVYDVYCAPYWNFTWKRYVQISEYQSSYLPVNQSANDSMNIMLALKEALGSSLYDIQVVPYCPLRDLMGRPTHSSVVVDEEDEDKTYALFKDGNDNIIAGLFYSKMSQFEFNVATSISMPNLGGQYGIPSLTAAENVKLVDGVTKYRLVSPNYSGQFEFSVAKNNGVSSFNVDCTYKPFSPYIHVNPAFKNMYGQDWNDARGLICGGDFSLSQVSDAFTEYSLQNKNYQEIFDRQIQNMDVNNSIARTEAVWGAVAGTVKGGAEGAKAGAKMGGVSGAIIGGVAGTALAGAGGIADYQLLKQRQDEARDFSVDMYGYNLSNVKAIPYSLTKVGALNGNNKLFPFVETYYATDEEMAAFAKKVKADGMTIMTVGTMYELCVANPVLSGDKKMFKGQIIRFDDSEYPLKADAHLAEALNAELMKGVYF